MGCAIRTEEGSSPYGVCHLVFLLYFLFLWCTTIAAIWLRVVNASTSYGWQLNCRKSARLENIKCIGLQLLARTRLVVVFYFLGVRAFDQIRAVLALPTNKLKYLVNLFYANTVRNRTNISYLSNRLTDSIDLFVGHWSSYSPCVLARRGFTCPSLSLSSLRANWH